MPVPPDPRPRSDPVTPDLIRQGFSPRLIGREIVFFDTIDSTNKILRQAAARGAVAGTVVLAEEQTDGRGRLNRVWVSPPGVGIYLSVLLRPAGSTRPLHLYTFLSAVAVTRALRQVSGLPVFIQWPNDIMLRGRKLGGILAEVRGQPLRDLEVVIGLGININNTAADLPSSLHDVATSLALAAGRTFPRAGIIREVLLELDRGYALMQTGDSVAILEEWRRLSPSHYGKPVVVTGGSAGAIRGTTRGIDDDGALLVERADRGLERVTFGEVRRVRGG